MKNLKFRAWHKKEKRMLTVSEINFDREYVIHEEPLYINECFNRSSDLDEIELMQFTGLYDKNNVPIFEGDVLQHESGFKIKAEFDYQEWCEDGFYTGILLGGKSDQYTVIGNIYETPELLK